jgi:SAM-dependent methyltransferase
MREWVAFWNSEHSIYVNARHRDVHYRTIADDIRAYVPAADVIVLDYGCGEALHADRIAAAAGRLILCDAAPAVRAGLSERFADNAKIEVRAPEDIEALGAATLDLVVMNSVAQYLSAEELERALALFHRLLRPRGQLLLGDIVPPSNSIASATLALLRFAAANGFLPAALGGLARTAFSDYRRLRARLGISCYEAETITAKLAAAGFAAERMPRNIGHNQARMTFLATKAG